MAHVFTQIYKAEPLDVADALRKLLEMPGVTTAADLTWSLVLECWPQPISALGDAIIATVAHQGRHDAVATFDGNLRKKLVKQGSLSYWPARA
jgi:rRNA-processing protein FCF1